MAGICFSSSLSPYRSQSSRSPIIYPVSISLSQHLSTVRNPQISNALKSSEVPLKSINASFCKKSRRFHEFRSGKVPPVECTKQQGEASNEEGSSNGVLQIGNILSAGFPLCVALACFAGFVRPQAFLWIRGKWQIACLQITMQNDVVSIKTSTGNPAIINFHMDKSHPCSAVISIWWHRLFIPFLNLWSPCPLPFQVLTSLGTQTR